MTNLLSFLLPEDKQWLREHGWTEPRNELVDLSEWFGGSSSVWITVLDDSELEAFEVLAALPYNRGVWRDLLLVAFCMLNMGLRQDREKMIRTLARWPRGAVERLIAAAYRANSMVRSDA